MLSIKVENLSKAYQLGQIGTGSLSRDLERWLAKVRGKEDPFVRIGEINDRTTKGISDIVWSLKDINFEIQEGDAVGIIGRNGAGKSTLLKILSKVTSPTTGNIKIKGRIASLLEVGTGFHPELTGRENIFLNGAILGMRKKEIARKFDEIVDFAGIERYIDTPVKRYSSGMYVRLAFAVAAYLESENLIVDEVLAVGDSEFQKKCIGKMENVSEGEGRTVLFVSHNMTSIRKLCKKVLVLQNGNLNFEGRTIEAIEKYIDEEKKLRKTLFLKSKLKPEKNACFNSIQILNKNKKECNEFDVFDQVVIFIEVQINNPISNISISINLIRDDQIILRSFDIDRDIELLYNERRPGKYLYKINLPTPIKAGYYKIDAHLGTPNNQAIDVVEDKIFIRSS